MEKGQKGNRHNYDSDFLLNNAFITGVSGRLGDRVFYTRNGRVCSRRHVVPANPRTRKQQAGRSRFAEAVRAWRELDEGARADWKRRARRSSHTGYNLFIAEYLTGRMMPHGMARFPWKQNSRNGARCAG